TYVIEEQKQTWFLATAGNDQIILGHVSAAITKGQQTRLDLGWSFFSQQFIIIYFMARFWRFIEDVITETIDYHLFNVVVEFHRLAESSNVYFFMILYAHIDYHLKELRYCAQCLVYRRNEDFVKRRDIEQVKKSESQNNEVMRYQALKRKPLTEAQARKNMMIYLKNMDGFKMNFFKGMTYSEIRPLFEKHYNSIKAFLEKEEEVVTVQKKEIKEEGRKDKIMVNDDDDVYTEATPLASKVPVVDY
nr:hypothetical protein [Tanacetum cinerariifolium]